MIGRRLEQVVVDRLRVAPVVVLHGPRTVGKSTLLRRPAAATGGQVIDLDSVPLAAHWGPDDLVRAWCPR